MAAELEFLKKELNGTQKAFVDAMQEIKKLSKYVTTIVVTNVNSSLSIEEDKS